ncbi:lasso peptide [Pelatocladus sp. BLCC-F211]|uniref:lasso peptide n=1 Tax=Pelatocladus sp. BLCC-F211 TaxID=3342752 RepID=UPI0035BA9D8C
MKSAYSTPTLTVHGDVAEITQILGSKDRVDFLFFTGGNSSVSGNNDIGSRDVFCNGNSLENLGNCTSK